MKAVQQLWFSMVHQLARACSALRPSFYRKLPVLLGSIEVHGRPLTQHLPRRQAKPGRLQFPGLKYSHVLLSQVKSEDDQPAILVCNNEGVSFSVQHWPEAKIADLSMDGFVHRGGSYDRPAYVQVCMILCDLQLWQDMDLIGVGGFRALKRGP